MSADINTQVSEDIAKAESLSIPLLIILLILVFGSLAAASLPLAVGLVAILGAFTALRALSLFGDVSIFSVNIVTMLGLGLAIDYALFIVSRFREELHEGLTVEDAVVRTVATAGRTVAFSGITVAVSLSGAPALPAELPALDGRGRDRGGPRGHGGRADVLPALLGVLGPRVDALRVPLPWTRRRLARPSDPDAGAWARLARGVMRRPVPVCRGRRRPGRARRAVPAGHLRWRRLPRAAGRDREPARRRGAPGRLPELERRHRSTSWSVMPTIRPRSPRTPPPSQVPGVTSAEVERSEGGSALVVVTAPGSRRTRRPGPWSTTSARSPAPAGADVLVGGVAAAQVDLLDGLGRPLPWVGLLLATAMFVLLFLAFGSVVLPVKAIVMNVLSLSATFGILVWVFQEGHLAGLLGFTSTGSLEATQPILIFAMAFGLSMDYEVFLLSRIREEWDASHDNTQAVARGLQRTGGIITSAALLFVVVVGAFATSGHRVHRDDRGRADRRGARRRHARAGAARAGHHAAAGPLELVGAGPPGALVGPSRHSRGRRAGAPRRSARRRRRPRSRRQYHDPRQLTQALPEHDASGGEPGTSNRPPWLAGGSLAVLASPSRLVSSVVGFGNQVVVLGERHVRLPRRRSG